MQVTKSRGTYFDNIAATHRNGNRSSLRTWSVEYTSPRAIAASASDSRSRTFGRECQCRVSPSATTSWAGATSPTGRPFWGERGFLAPPPAEDLRSAIAEADAVRFSTPEYNGGAPAN